MKLEVFGYFVWIGKMLFVCVGVGFKFVYVDVIFVDSYWIGFLEVYVENYMGVGGYLYCLLICM